MRHPEEREDNHDETLEENLIEALIHESSDFGPQGRHDLKVDRLGSMRGSNSSYTNKMNNK